MGKIQPQVQGMYSDSAFCCIKFFDFSTVDSMPIQTPCQCTPNGNNAYNCIHSVNDIVKIG